MAMYEVGTVTGAASQAGGDRSDNKVGTGGAGDTAGVDSGGLPQR